MIKNNSDAVSLGDSHNGEKTALVQGENGAYIYKPRDAKTEHAFQEFMLLMQRKGLSYIPGFVDILSEDKHSHTEKPVEHMPTDKDGVKKYYKRAGTLLFFFYLFGTTDMHAENIIASGEFPVCVDLETLLSGEPLRKSGGYNLSLSVMRSHLLPNFLPSQESPLDCSGLSGVTAQYMNLPHCENRRFSAWEYEHELITGFFDAYNFALKNKTYIYGALDLFANCKVRQLLRPTDTYSQISGFLQHIDEKKRGEIARAMIERAYKNDIDKERITKVEKIIQAETNAVLDGEIPLFYSMGNDCDLYCNSKKVLCTHLAEPPVDFAKSRLKMLCNNDLDTQKKIISLALSSARKPRDNTETPSITTIDNKGENPHFTDEIFSELESCCVPELPGAFTKLSEGKSNVFFESAGYALYDGLSGIMCCYAALYRKTDDKKYKKRLDSLCEKLVRDIIDNPYSVTLSAHSCSLANGISGIIKALFHIGELCEDKRYFDLCKALGEKFDTDTVSFGDNVNCDVLTGISGLALCLPLIDRAKAKKLADIISPVIISADFALSGTAHGCAGTSLALCELQNIYNDNRFDEKILYLLQYENKHLDMTKNNWVDLRDKSKKGFMSGWCSGAPGIGMARQKLLLTIGNEEIRQICKNDIKTAQAFLLSESDTKRSTLCCGLASRVVAASYLGIPLERSYNKLSHCTKADDGSLYHIIGTRDKNATLMQGLAGVGYALCMYGDSLAGGMLV